MRDIINVTKTVLCYSQAMTDGWIVNKLIGWFIIMAKIEPEYIVK